MTVHLTEAHANQIADALLGGCFLVTDQQHAHPPEPRSLEAAALENTYNDLRAALNLIEKAIVKSSELQAQ